MGSAKWRTTDYHTDSCRGDYLSLLVPQEEKSSKLVKPRDYRSLPIVIVTAEQKLLSESPFHTTTVLPPPSLPMDDGIETGKVLGKGVPLETIIAANPVYGAKLRKSCVEVNTVHSMADLLKHRIACILLASFSMMVQRSIKPGHNVTYCIYSMNHKIAVN